MFSRDVTYIAIGGMDRAFGLKRYDNHRSLKDFDLDDWHTGWDIANRTISGGADLWNANRQLPEVSFGKKIEVKYPSGLIEKFNAVLDDEEGYSDHWENLWVSERGGEFSSEADLDPGFLWRFVE